METAGIRRVVDVWAAQETELAARPEIGYVQIFENRGAMMGASNPHSHGQIWATEPIPNEPAAELKTQREFYGRTHKAMLSEYLSLELKQGEQIVAENASRVALVPFWAVWPFEVLLMPRAAASTLRSLSEGQGTQCPRRWRSECGGSGRPVGDPAQAALHGR